VTGKITDAEWEGGRQVSAAKSPAEGSSSKVEPAPLPPPPPPPPPPPSVVAAGMKQLQEAADDDIILSDVDLDEIDLDSDEDSGSAHNQASATSQPPSSLCSNPPISPAIFAASSSSTSTASPRRVMIVGVVDSSGPEEGGGFRYDPARTPPALPALKAVSRLSSTDRLTEAQRKANAEAAAIMSHQFDMELSEGDSDSEEGEGQQQQIATKRMARHDSLTRRAARDVEEDDDDGDRKAVSSPSSGWANGSSSASAAVSSASSLALVGASFSSVESCRGWLQKYSIGKSSILKFNNWKRRFFVLAVLGEMVSLGYYEDETCKKLVGMVKLDPTDTRLVAHPSTTTHRKAKKPGLDLVLIFYEVVKGDRRELRLVLRCDSRDDHRMWVTALQAVIPVCDAPTDFPLD
jgi:hypothetical protein